jgi:putative redox protein
LDWAVFSDSLYFSKDFAMVEIDSEYQGNLRCQSTHLDSGSRLLTDAPKDNQGNGESFSPTDLVATALVTCMLTTMAIVARRLNVDLTRATARVKKEMVSAPHRRIGTLTVEIIGPADLPTEIREQLERAALGCPVYRSLHPDIQLPVNFKWKG